MTPKLVITAKLCGELARVAESRELPHLLERAARVLDASGIIVWIAEPSRQALVPALAHGYEQRVVARMGSIHRDANNAAAAAYRSSEVRTVAGDAVTSGAVIVPLMTSDGCIGVLVGGNEGGLRERRERSGARDHLRRTARDNRRHTRSRLLQSRRPGLAVRLRVVTVYEQ